MEKRNCKGLPYSRRKEIIFTLKRSIIDVIYRIGNIFDLSLFDRLYYNLETNYMGMVVFYIKLRTRTKSSTSGLNTKRTVDGQIKMSDITITQYNRRVADE